MLCLQVAHDRRMYNTWPSYLQHTVFRPEYAAVRWQRPLFPDLAHGLWCVHLQDTRPIAERLAEAVKLKNDGNDLFKSGQFPEAMQCYERAVGMFKHVVNVDPEWRASKKGLRDEDIRIVEVECEDREDQLALDDLRVRCYQNMAAVALKVRTLVWSV